MEGERQIVERHEMMVYSVGDTELIETQGGPG